MATIISFFEHYILYISRLSPLPRTKSTRSRGSLPLILSKTLASATSCDIKSTTQMLVFICIMSVAGLLCSSVHGQAPFSNARGRGARALSPLPPPLSLATSGSDPECVGLTFRPINGRCTSAANAALGEAGRAQFSYFNLNSIQPIGADLPSPRLVSNVVVEQEGEDSNSGKLNELFTFFGQFIDHDSALTPVNSNEAFDIEIPEDDPFLSAPLEFFRSQRAAVSQGSSVERPITAATSALDLSTVYGPDEERNELLRINGDCRLKTSAGNFLPLNSFGLENGPPGGGARFFAAGDSRSNETPMLTIMHTIWVREHNFICDTLESDPSFGVTDPDELFEMARAVTIAEYQKIVYNEWLPALLGSTLSTYSGYDSSVDPTVSVEFTTAAFRLGHTLVGNDVTRVDSTGTTLPPIPATEMFFLTAEDFVANGLEDFLRGSIVTKAQEFDEKIVDSLRNLLFEEVPNEEGFDLMALNLQRARDHNIPSFNDIREFFLGSRVSSFSQISTSSAANLEEAYGDVDKVEAWIGLMAEDKKPGSVVGPTLDAFLRTEFGRLRDGDQFFYLISGRVPDIVLSTYPSLGSDIFSPKNLFNKILKRNSNIENRFVPGNSNSFKA